MTPWGENSNSSRCGEAAAQPSSAGMNGAAAALTPRARSSARRDIGAPSLTETGGTTRFTAH